MRLAVTNAALAESLRESDECKRAVTTNEDASTRSVEVIVGHQLAVLVAEGIVRGIGVQSHGADSCELVSEVQDERLLV